MEHPVQVATVVRPHGLRGEVIADGPETPSSVVAALPALQMRIAGGWRRLPLRAVRPHAGRLILSFDGVESVEQAESLRGRPLFAEAGDLPALPAGTHYAYRLVDLRVETRDGALLGRVLGTERGVAQDRLVVETVSGRQALVPMVPALIRAIEPERGRVVVEVPEGLLEGDAEIAGGEAGGGDGEPTP